MLSQFIQPTGIRNYPGTSKDPIVSLPADRGLAVYNMAAFNKSGSSMDVGLARLFNASLLKLYALESSAYTLRDFSAGAQQIFTTTIGDGFAVGAKEPPSLVGVNVSTAGAGGVYKLQYWDGSAWQDIASDLISKSDDYSATGENFQVTQEPLGWAKGGPAGLDQGLYYLQVVSTTAPAGPVSADEFWGAQILSLFPSTPDGGFAQLSFDWNKPHKFDAGESLVPYFQTADAANFVSGFYAIFG
jgi:hypothetical protein